MHILLNAIEWATISEGIVISIVGYLVVFMALILLYTFFHFMSKALKWYRRRKLAKEGRNDLQEADLDIPGDVNAAIGMAMYLYFLHDEESDVLTIKKVSKTYSPWSSKIYGLRQFPK